MCELELLFLFFTGLCEYTTWEVPFTVLQLSDGKWFIAKEGTHGLLHEIMLKCIINKCKGSVKIKRR